MGITREELTGRIEKFASEYAAIEHEMQKVVIGQLSSVRTVLGSIILGGHVLLEGLPGTGKTHIGKTLGEVLALTLSRIQCTPDLMPTDIIGTYVITETPQGRRTFEFQRGPLFGNIILADHINRTTPRTQAAMLEAMEQDKVSVSTEEFTLPRPFCVIATQNPLEQEGTYPLPEAQIDRFMFQARTSMPTAQELEIILDRTTGAEPVAVRTLADASRILSMREIVRSVDISAELRRWVVALACATDPTSSSAPDEVKRYIRYGAGPRGVQAVVLGAKFLAAISARCDVRKEDILQTLQPALRHRLFLNFEGHAEGVNTDSILEQVQKIKG